MGEKSSRGEDRLFCTTRVFLLIAAVSCSALTNCGFDCNSGQNLPWCPTPSKQPPQPTPTIQLIQPTIDGVVISNLSCTYGGANTCAGATNSVTIDVNPEDEVLAMQTGSVRSESGNCLTLDLGAQGALTGDWQSTYCGLSSITVAVGQQVAQGDQVGICCSATALNLGVSYNGKAMDPLKYIVDSTYSNLAPTCGGSCPAKSLGVTGSADAGLESSPRWLWSGKVAESFKGVPSAKPARGRRLSRPKLSTIPPIPVDLSIFLPSAFGQTQRLLSTPTSILGASNALNVAGAEYWQSGMRVLSAAVFQTADSPYVHDYAVCTRFKAGFLAEAAVVDVSGAIPAPYAAYLWGSQAYQSPDFSAPSVQEYEATFVVYFTGKQATTMSRWIEDEYPVQTGADVLTFQIWADTPEIVGQFAQTILAYIRSLYTVTIDQSPQMPPDFVLASAEYDGSDITLNLRSLTATPLTGTATVTGWSNMIPSSATTTTETVAIPAGDSVLRLHKPALLDAVAYISDGSFTDKVYVSDGQWEVWSGGMPMVSMAPSSCGPVLRSPTGRVVPGCVSLSGAVPGDHGPA